MRQYGSIQTSFWANAAIKPLSDQAKLLATYILSSSHTNMLGCFRIPIGYIAEDLNWCNETVLKVLAELIKVNFILRDQANDWIMITDFFKNQPIDNPNQAKGVEKIFYLIPENIKFIDKLAESLLSIARFFSDDFRQHLLTLSKGFLNQKQKQNQKQKKDMSGKKIIFPKHTSPSIPAMRNSSLKTQAIEVLDFLNKKAGRAYRAVDTNLKFIIAGLKSGATVDDCRQVIAKKTREWKSNPKMAEYLRPATLFNAEKFEQYLGELVLSAEVIRHGKK